MATYHLNREKLMGIVQRRMPYSIKLLVDGVEFFGRQRWYNVFDMTLGYLNATEVEEIESLKEGSFIFYPYDDIDSGSYVCILGETITSNQEFYLNGIYNANIIKTRFIEIDE